MVIEQIYYETFSGLIGNGLKLNNILKQFVICVLDYGCENRKEVVGYVHAPITFLVSA
jgi:hypothetical protein